MVAAVAHDGQLCSLAAKERTPARPPRLCSVPSGGNQETTGRHFDRTLCARRANPTRDRQFQHDVPRVKAFEIAAKKKALYDSQQDSARVKRLRRKFIQQIAQEFHPHLHHLKFLDEFGVHLGMTRWYGRAAPGKRVAEATPGFSGNHYTVVALMSLAGTAAPLIFEGAMNTNVFESYLQQMLAPTLRLGDLLVMDNLSSHKSEKVRRLIEARGARLVFLPPYSPDLNPIEKCWSKIKTALRSAKARSFEALVAALAKALRSVSLANIQSWFAHCGYA